MFFALYRNLRQEIFYLNDVKFFSLKIQYFFELHSSRHQMLYFQVNRALNQLLALVVNELILFQSNIIFFSNLRKAVFKYILKNYINVI